MTGWVERLRRRLRHAASDDPLDPVVHHKLLTAAEVESGLTEEGYTVITLDVALHTLSVLAFALERAGRRDGTVPAGTALPLSAARSVLESAKLQGVEW